MRRALLVLLMLAALTVPAMARADGAPITLPEYRNRLEQVVQKLEAAEGATSASAAEEDRAAALEQLGTTWTVTTDQGSIAVDNRELAGLIGQAAERARLEAALTQSRELLAAADEVAKVQRVDMADARRRLDLALSLGGVQQRWYERIGAWLSHLWRALSPATGAGRVSGPWVSWTALALGLAGVLLLSRSLIRSLSGHAGGDEAGPRQERRAQERALTPAELREKARHLSAEGEHREGLRLLHRALLGHLDQLGLLRYVPAQTNREHERALRRRYPGLAGTLHLLNDLMDMRLYSDAPATHAEFNQAEAWVETLWREGDALSKSAEAMAGPLSSAPSP